MTSKDDNYVRSVERGLRILSEVSRSKGIVPGEVSKRLGIPRPSVYRILGALETLGYVARSASDNRFRVTLKAREIADGYDDETQAGALGGPVMVGLQRQLVWPVDILTYENGAMVIRESTLNRSPMSINRNMIGTRAPILRSSAGRAWLAFALDKEREICLNMLRLRNDPEDLPYLDPTHLAQILACTRNQGYGLRHAEKLLPETSSFAMPVIVDARVICCINVIWITSALSIADARNTLLEPLRQAAAKMAEQFSAGYLVGDRVDGTDA